MGAYLDEYGTVIVEAITGVIVLALMYLALAAAGGAEVYSNTGGQASKSTPLGAIAKS